MPKRPLGPDGTRNPTPHCTNGDTACDPGRAIHSYMPAPQRLTDEDRDGLLEKIAFMLALSPETVLVDCPPPQPELGHGGNCPAAAYAMWS